MIRPEFDKKKFPHWIRIPIRFRDLDPLNHVNNAIFSTFYEEARVAFIADIPVFRHAMKHNLSFVLANINIDFVIPVKYPAKLLVGTGIKKVNTTSICSFQAIYHADSKKLVSVADVTGVWFDMKKQAPAPVPEIEDVNDFMIEV